MQMQPRERVRVQWNTPMQIGDVTEIVTEASPDEERSDNSKPITFLVATEIGVTLLRSAGGSAGFHFRLQRKTIASFIVPWHNVARADFKEEER